jgi:hypothetical protein
MEGLSVISPGGEETPPAGEETLPAEPDSFPAGAVFGREEFFARLERKMAPSVREIFQGLVLGRLVESVKFFSRAEFHPGDFAAAVRILSGILDIEKASGIILKPTWKEHEDKRRSDWRCRRKIKCVRKWPKKR